MCGIIGYTGSENVKDVLLDALELLEYRGYDSAGIAVKDETSHVTNVYKCAGRVSDLRAICDSKKILSTCGIGHTRWATHGGVTDQNAHPHQQGKVTLVHNGIIENYRELIADYDLQEILHSETDSEVAAALLNHYYKGNPKEAIKKAVSKLKGTFALVILFEDQPDVIYSIRNVSPIVATICKEGAMLASDLTALCRFTNEYFVVPEYHILELHKDHVVLTDLNDNVVEPEFLSVDWELNSAGKNGYPFYMEKEIMEQPEAINSFVREKPDLILMDIRMPVMDGIQATEKIRTISLSVPIIAVTAYAFYTEQQQAIQAGCNAVISKPYSLEKLKETIESYIG